MNMVYNFEVQKHLIKGHQYKWIKTNLQLTEKYQ